MPGSVGGAVATGHAGSLRCGSSTIRAAAHPEAFAPGLRTFLVAIQVDRHELAGQGDEGRVLNRPALSWLHGGHQTAPQYSSTGFSAVGGFGEGIIDVTLAPRDSLGPRRCPAELAVETGAGVQALSAEASSNMESATRIGSISKGKVTGHWERAGNPLIQFAYDGHAARHDAPGIAGAVPSGGRPHHLLVDQSVELAGLTVNHEAIAQIGGHSIERCAYGQDRLAYLRQHRLEQCMADALSLAAGIDEQHRQVAAFLQLDHADDTAVLLGHQEMVVAVQAFTERIGGGDIANVAMPAALSEGATAAVNAARHTALIAGRSSTRAGRIVGMQCSSVAGCASSLPRACTLSCRHE